MMIADISDSKYTVKVFTGKRADDERQKAVQEAAENYFKMMAKSKSKE